MTYKYLRYVEVMEAAVAPKPRTRFSVHGPEPVNLEDITHEPSEYIPTTYAPSFDSREGVVGETVGFPTDITYIIVPIVLFFFCCFLVCKFRPRC
jgi:hypothetical protein